MAILSMLTPASFRRWLQETEVEATPCDDTECILAKWLNDEGFPNASVDGETIYLYGDDSNPEDGERFECPKWAEAVVTCFDGLARAANLFPYRFTPMSPETYRGPLLALVYRLEHPPEIK